MHAFDLAGPLPTETTVLEASAGTGKTYAIAALAVRFLAERDDIDITSLLMITFGNHAARELRGRIFERLQHTLEILDLRLAGMPTPGADAVDLELIAGDATQSRFRLRDALARFNESTITTTHSFCDTMLRELGMLGSWDPDEVVGPDDHELARQCASDIYLQLFRSEPEPPFGAREALSIGVAVCETALPLLPEHGPRRDFADAVRALYQSRKTIEGICTFNDVIVRLRSALTDPRTGALARAALAERFPIVLVDEFQDTDPDQWDIIERAFVAPGRPTILIGDPKQSIYGFRGADLGSYLRARSGATVFTLATNYRSDRPLVDGIVNLFAGAELGSAEVMVTPVAAKHAGARLQVPGSARVWLRRSSHDELRDVDGDTAIAHDLIRQLRTLLAQARLHNGEPVRASDIAVLTRTTARARELRDVLTSAGLPAILTGSQSVWHQRAAQEWLLLLKAMSEPTQSHIRLASLTSLVGADFDSLLSEASQESARISTLVRELAQGFEIGGMGQVLAVLRARTQLDARLLSEEDGARHLTDIVHLAELLDARPDTELPNLIAMLMDRGSDHDDSDAIRIESDEAAIRVMTMHAAKGLEFPIVALPETGGAALRMSRPFSVIEDNRRHLHVGPKPDWRDEVTKDAQRQAIEEELRLLYVGFTRAKHLAVAWHVSDSTRRSSDGPLSRLLSAHGWRHQRNGTTRLINLPLIFDSKLDEGYPGPAPEVASVAPLPRLTLAQLTREIDHTWRRTSYSGLTQGLHESGVRMVTDEAAALTLSRAREPLTPELDVASPMAKLPAGAGFGTLVHAALERLDWSPGHLKASLSGILAELAPANGLDEETTQRLAQALELVCRTPLNPLAKSSLSDLPTSARLPELDFDLPLADDGLPATLAELAELMSRHLPSDDPLADYPTRLASSEAGPAVLNGFLTGSIDAVLRLPNNTFAVIDYKTNRLSSSASEPLTLGHYTAPAMAEAMMQAHYPLQASLYCVALHRYLSLRLTGYKPETHLAGVGYLFVRGMAGESTPMVAGTTCGVFGWFPPAPFVVAASELLGGHRG